MEFVTVGGLLLAWSHGVEQLGLCRRNADPDNQIFDMLFEDLSTRHEARHCYTANN
jgi:hypothetical protein